MAENLPDEDADAPSIFGWRAWVNKNDPYVEVFGYGTGGDDKIKVQQTTVKEGSETPQWDEEFEFDDADSNGPYTKFLFKIWDDDQNIDDGSFNKDGSFKKDGPRDWLDINDPDYLGETREVMVAEITDCVNEEVFRLPVSRDGKEIGILLVGISKDGCSDGSGTGGNGGAGQGNFIPGLGMPQ
eukprot:CAMPEP_0201563860 /NCGR_PEP_ID=MMETSP0190_2-20130828/1394_1 /ASSEMBLY_ACC=CAM_ASM_000263 /TAXON_ID=37353 /ORGANISM="Rosalina sp." /LENGTH=183 /DNA_ID=CAMNT_0047979211 /DNA_START=184 /DNA_END=732 /DNA_ORIENTATION=-